MSGTPALTLVSHALCPYVQRAAIVLREKDVAFSRRWVDLADKPAWFTAISPLGKTPVLLAGEAPVFESAVICDYLDETLAPRLHPEDPLERARHRGWVAFASSVLDTIWRYYTAADAAAMQAQREGLLARFATLEAALAPGAPWFAGERFSIVDAAFAPVFRYFDAFEALGERGWFEQDTPQLQAWRGRLARRASVREAVLPNFADRLLAFLRSRDSELGRRAAAQAQAVSAALP